MCVTGIVGRRWNRTRRAHVDTEPLGLARRDLFASPELHTGWRLKRRTTGVTDMITPCSCPRACSVILKVKVDLERLARVDGWIAGLANERGNVGARWRGRRRVGSWARRRIGTAGRPQHGPGVTRTSSSVRVARVALLAVVCGRNLEVQVPGK